MRASNFEAESPSLVHASSPLAVHRTGMLPPMAGPLSSGGMEAGRVAAPKAVPKVPQPKIPQKI